METSLHRQLKEMYASKGDDTQIEVPLDEYRIDVVAGTVLVEIQHGSLAAIRDKVSQLVKRHRVKVVKPIVVRKMLVKLEQQGGPQIGRRLSPKQGSILDLFDELVYFTRVFPHRNLLLEAPLVEIEEWRFPGHGRRRRWRKNDHQIEDQRLVKVGRVHRFRQARDLLRLLPARLPQPFHTGQLAERMQIERWQAQRIAYCLRETGAVKQAGKQGNTILYRIPPSRKPARKTA